MLKTKPVVLWVFPETTTTVTLASVCETLQPLFCTIADYFPGLRFCQKDVFYKDKVVCHLRVESSAMV